MKKIFSLLICVILGIISVYAGDIVDQIDQERIATVTVGPRDYGSSYATGGGRIYYLETSIGKTVQQNGGLGIEINQVTSSRTYTDNDKTLQAKNKEAQNTFQCIFIYACPSEGYYFDFWAEYKNGEYVRNGFKGNFSTWLDNDSIVRIGTYSMLGGGSDSDDPVTRYAIFKPSMCYYNILEAEVVVVDAEGNIIQDFNPNPSEYQVRIDEGAWGASIKHNNPRLISCGKQVPGIFGGHTYEVKSPSDDKAYEFVGWFKDIENSSIYENGNINQNKQLVDIDNDNNSKTCKLAEQETSDLYNDFKEKPTQAPRVPKVYAVFKASSIALYRYNAEIDKFSEAMPPVEHDEGEWVKYVDVPYATNETLYKLEHTFGEQLKIESNVDFVGTLDKVQGLDILRVNPISEGDLSGVITFVVGETPIAKLHLSAKSDNNYPSITLKPADDLLGTYTYTQQSTGSQEFSVTTSEVQKLLIKETDKMFTFKATPTDPNKAEFMKWVIEIPAEDNIEDTRSTFSYRFKGGESIKPVFRSTEYATFIIKSRPEIKYYDLQDALDAAADMDNPQEQVVTVYAPTATSVRLKYKPEGYKIKDGVTFLIPGDATYTTRIGDLQDDVDCVPASGYGSAPAMTTHCKLIVDDNTNITVENGNISVYSRILVVQRNNGGRLNHGWLKLGKNCNITVKKGGLYALGFITGDKSSSITMEERTTTYEIFHFLDWRGGVETYSMRTSGVFPIGQYYIQSIEIPLTLKYEAKHYVSTAIDVTAGSIYPVNMKLVDTYDTDYCLFGLGEGTTLTKTYDTSKDRIRFEINGTGAGTSKLKIGHILLDLLVNLPLVGDQSLKLDSKNFVLPIQNNMDIVVNNTTIDVTSDIAFMPSSTLHLRKDAVLNIDNIDPSSDDIIDVFVYSSNASRIKNAPNEGYWGHNNTPGAIMWSSANAGHTIRKQERPDGNVTRVNDYADATLIIDGIVNIKENGALYTVNGDYQEGVYGANITSNGGGKIYVNNIGTLSNTYQWYRTDPGNNSSGKKYPIPLTEPNLLLHNDISKQVCPNPEEPNACKIKYTSANKEGGVYTYYQNDGMWREDEEKLPISGIKLYDSNGKEINQFYVTMPTPTTINGYILASLENIGVTYNDIDFNVALSNGNIILNSNKAPYVDGDKLRIPVIYNVQNVHGSTTQTLTITNTNSAAFTCNFSAPVKAQENYTPVFSVPSTVNIYARVGEPTYAASPILCKSDNVVTLTKSDNSGDLKWTATFTHKEGNTTITNSDFEFVLGQELSGARIKYTPSDDIRRTVTLTLKATYKENVNCCGQTTLREHQVVINTYPSMVANTMEFNEVGTLLPGKEFELLRFVNSDVKPQLFINDTEVTGDSFRDNVISVGYNGGDASLSKPNYSVTVEGSGTVKVRVHQEANNGIEAKTIEKTFVVTSNPPALDEGICVSGDDASTIFNGLTSAVENKVQCSEGCITFAKSASWTAQFEGVAGNISFTPSGDGYWAVEESQGHGYNWEQTSIYWTKLTPRQRIVVNLQPKTRLIKISYSDNNPETENGGSITDFCINPLSIYAEIDHLYIPIKEGVVDPIFIDFTHSTPLLESAFAINKPDNWIQEVIARTKDDEANGNLNWGGDLNVYYKTRVKLSPKEGVSISEAKNVVAVTATKSQAESATVNVSTYNFPKPLPIYSTTWTPTTGDNGYLKSEYYYHYMVESSYVKWDEANQDVIFLNKGNDTEAKRQVVFGFAGMPDEVRFQSESNEWLIEESEDNTWTESPTTSNVSTKTVGETQYWYKEISQTAKYVRITYLGEALDEIVLNDLVIEGFPTAVARESDEINSAEVTEIILPDANSNKTATFYIHVKNLENLQLAMENSSGFTFKHGSNTVNFVNGIAAITGYDFLAVNKAGFIPMTVTWNAEHIVDEGYLRIQKPSANSGEPAQDLHVIHIVGKKDVVTKNDSKTGIWTGVPDGQAKDRPTEQAYQLRGLNDTYDPYPYHEVNVANAFDKDGKALFNYLVIYGETTTTNGSRIIYEADGSRGSNALTPYYIYERINETSYQLKQSVENANSPTKAVLDQVSHHVGIEGENEQMYYAIQPNDNDSVSFYMTGFCPYATTGSTMHDEGVWYFRGKEGSKVNIYLEDCHIYSRNKTVIGHKVGKYDEGVVEYTADDGVVKGSGAVLVFEHMSGETKPLIPFNVAIHTIGHNVFKSNYGAYLNVLGVGNVRAAQVSASVQVRLSHMKDSTTAYTNIDFDDKWPDVYDYSTKKITSIKRTNGFLSLQKQHNHAPSIDLGNRNTVVNFRGGRVELQNATVVSPNYKTTLAISHRSGLMGNIKDFNFSLGLGTDDVGGTVNFYDGTTTVIDLYVDAAYKDFYLIDKNANGEEITRNNKGKTEYLTTCLRTPANTFIYGGSHCMLRACKYVTSSGGAPKDKNGEKLARYVYDKGYTINKYGVANNDPAYNLVTPTAFPTGLTYKGNPLEDYYASYPNGKYALESVTPDANDKLSFWIPGGVVEGITPEEDKLLTAWKASMTRIEAGFMEVNAGVGGVVRVNPDERITNLLYCQLDEYIHEVISEGCSDGECVYMAPVKDPTNGMLELEEPYVYIAPSHVGDSLQHSIVSEIDYEVTNKVYYVTIAKADTWMNFTLPFDVEKVHVVEAYREEEIEDYFNSLDKEEYDRMYETLRFQAKHNADFAAFFGMAMAMGDYAATFDDIYNDYTDWGLYVDSEPVKGEEDDGESNDDIPTREYYTGNQENYDWRTMRELTHYDGTNFSTSNYYLYKNNGDWTKFTGTDGKERFAVQWEVVPKVAPGETLMHKGETYSLLFPYCQGCDGEIVKNPETGKWEVKVDDDGYPVQKERDYWDYWSGKFIIFESTGATVNDPHEIRGSNYNEASKVGNSPWIFDNVNDLADQAVLSGNSTFHMMDLNQYTSYKNNIYEYSSVRGLEQYKSPIDEYNTTYSTIAPTNTFLLTNHSKPVRSIARDGRIVTDGDSSGNQGTTTGGNIPTVGGGHSMFITGVDGGINVAVSTPQQVFVISATGTILYSGYVNDNVDIPLPINGIYIVKGETEVQKIFY